MVTSNKTRLNLYLDSQLVEFAKKWSYVSGQPISRLLEEHLRQVQERVKGSSPFQWLNEQERSQPASGEEKERAELEAYLFNREEEEFCRGNPEHPRAKMHQKLLRDYEQSQSEAREQRQKRERDFITRWIKVFPIK